MAVRYTEFIQLCTYMLAKRENGEHQANCNFPGEEAEFVDCFVAVPDCFREFVVTNRVDDDPHEEKPSAQSCMEEDAHGV